MKNWALTPLRDCGELTKLICKQEIQLEGVIKDSASVLQFLHVFLESQSAYKYYFKQYTCVIKIYIITLLCRSKEPYSSGWETVGGRNQRSISLGSSSSNVC